MKKIIVFIGACFCAMISISGYSRLDSYQENFKTTKDTLTDLQILTDSTIQYDFGYACYKSGVPPKGRQAIDRLIQLKDFESIKAVLDGQNNEGQIYAIEALLVLVSKGQFILSEDDKAKIKQIINQNFLIRRCQGCIVSSIKTIDLFNQKGYRKLLKKNHIKIKN
jgi:hypothetical protein